MASARNVTRDTDLATSLEVASSLWAKFMGLMGRSTLPAGSGLWLPDSNGIHMMFMRFPIDAVFLGRPVAGSEAAGSAAAGSAAGSVAGSAAGSVAGSAAGSVGSAAGSAGSARSAAGSVGSAAAVGSAARPVVSVHRGVRAWTGLVPFIHGAHGVLELPTGTIDATGTVRGDLIVIE